MLIEIRLGERAVAAVEGGEVEESLADVGDGFGLSRHSGVAVFAGAKALQDRGDEAAGGEVRFVRRHVLGESEGGLGEEVAAAAPVEDDETVHPGVYRRLHLLVQLLVERHRTVSHVRYRYSTRKGGEEWTRGRTWERRMERSRILGSPSPS